MRSNHLLRRWPLIFLFLAFVFTGVSLWSQEYSILNYGIHEGLPQSQVYDMVCDKDGQIWMATRGGGVARFDGETFAVFNTSSGLSNNFVYTLFIDQDEKLWVGTGQGLNRFDGKEIESSLDDYVISGICQPADGSLWIGTNDGLFIQEDSLVHQSELMENAIMAIANNSIQVLAAGETGVSLIEKDSVVRFFPNTMFRGRNVSCITAYDQGFLVGTFGGGVYRVEDNSVLNISESLYGYVIHDIHIQENQLWIATLQNGVIVYDTKDESLSSITTQTGLCNDHVRCFVSDPWRNIWIGSSGGGISKYIGKRFLFFDQESGLTGDYVYDLALGKDETIWLSTAALGLTLYDGEEFQKVDFPKLNNTKIRALDSDTSYHLWIGTEGKGVFLLAENRLEQFTVLDGIHNNWVKDFQPISDTVCYVATAGGVSKLVKREIWQVNPLVDLNANLDDTRVNCLGLLDNNLLVVGTRYAGLYIFEGEQQVDHVSMEDGLPNNTIRDVAIKNGKLWIITAGHGLVCYDPYDMSLQAIGRQDGLRSENIYAILKDHAHGLWLGHESGVDHILLDDADQIQRITNYGIEDGFKGSEATTNGSIVDQKGRLWFGTVDGLVMHQSDHSIEPSLPPTLVIRDVSLLYASILSRFEQGAPDLSTSPIYFKHKENHISISFFGIHQRHPSRVMYSWRLIGLNDKWSPNSDRRYIDFANLSPGDYRFEVRATTDERTWSNVAGFQFVVQPPFWQTWWFFVISILGGALILTVVFLVTIRRIRSRDQEIKEQLRIENQLLELEQKALHLQMKPHFIFNALNSIQGLIAGKDIKSARLYMTKFAKLLRLILENSTTNTIALSKELDLLSSYCEFEQFLKEDSFDFEISCEDSLQNSGIQIPNMMIQPFVENAIIHGFAQLKDRRGRLEIQFKKADEDSIRISVIDNGMGIKDKGQPDADKSSLATKIIRKRLELISETDAQLEICSNRSDSNEDGVTVSMIVPFE